MHSRCIIASLCFCFIVANHLHAQPTDIDSMEAVVNTQPDSLKIKTYYSLANAYLYSSTAKSIANGEKCLLLADQYHDYTMKGEAFSILGSNYKNRGEYPKALTYQLQALKIFEDMHDTTGLAICHNDIGILYKSMKQYDNAILNYEKSLSYCLAKKMGKGIAMTYNNIGTIYFEKDNTTEALKYYNLGLSKGKEINNNASIATSLSNIAELYAKEKNYAQAHAYFNQVYIIDKNSNDVYGQIYDLLSIGNIYSDEGKTSDALKNIEDALSLAIQIDARALKKECYLSLSNTYAVIGDYKNAYTFEKKHESLKDSMLNEDNQKQVAELQTLYETGKNEQQIAELNERTALQNLQINDEKSKTRIILLTAAALLLVVSMMSAFIISRNKLKQKTEIQKALTEQQKLRFKAVIETQETERKRIAEDLHDGLGQLLSTARLNIASLEDIFVTSDADDKKIYATALDLIDEACREVRNISHNMMPGALIKLGLIPAIRELVNKINNSHKMHIQFIEKGFESRVSESTEIALYRIAQEILNNNIKHSQATNIIISLINENNKVLLSVEDNGVGIDKLKIEKSEGIGWKNIFSRVAMINGNIDIDSEKGKGTKIEIAIAA